MDNQLVNQLADLALLCRRYSHGWPRKSALTEFCKGQSRAYLHAARLARGGYSTRERNELARIRARPVAADTGAV